MTTTRIHEDPPSSEMYMLHSDQFCDAAPAQVWATLLDEGVYLGSASTFYRLLRTAHGDVQERRAQATTRRT